MELSVSIADRAARLRAGYRLKTPDAIITATALESRATGLIGNDREFRRMSELEVFPLD